MTRSTLALVVAASVAAAGGLTACGPKMPMVPAARPVQPLQLPVAARPADASLVGYLRLRDPATLVDRIGSEQVRRLLSERKVPLEELRVGRPGGLFAWDPGLQGLSTVPVAALLPTPATGALARTLATLAGGEKLRPAPLGDDTLLVMSDFGRDKATTGAADLRRLLDAPGGGDARLFIDVASLMTKYGGLLRMGLAAVTAQAGDAAAQEMTRRNLAMALDWLDRTATLTVDTELGAEQVALVTTVERKAGATGQPITGPSGAIAAPPIVELLAPGAVRAQISTADVRALGEWSLSMQAPLYEKTPGALEEMRALFDDWSKLGPEMHSAASLSLGGGRLSGEAAVLLQHPEHALEIARKWLGRIGAGPLAEMNRKNGMVFKVTGAQAVRAIEGWPVDRYEMALTPVAGAQVNEAQRKTAAVLKGTVVVELMRLGPYLLYGINRPIDELAQRTFAGRTVTKLAAFASAPAGGFAYADVDVLELTHDIAQLAGKELKLPADPAAHAPMTFYGADAAAGWTLRLATPRAVLRALGTLPN